MLRTMLPSSALALELWKLAVCTTLLFESNASEFPVLTLLELPSLWETVEESKPEVGTPIADTGVGVASPESAGRIAERSASF